MSIARSRSRKASIVLVVLILAVAAVVAAGAVVLWQGLNPWPELRDEADRFDAPLGFDLIDQFEKGSTFCFVSCDDPRVVLVYVTDQSITEVCSAVYPSLESYGGELIHNSGGPCNTMSLPDVDCYQCDGAISAVAQRTGMSTYRDLADVDLPVGRTVVAIVFNSGIE